MSANDQPQGAPPGGEDVYRNRLIVGLGLFLVFFVYYVGAAVIQTPSCKDFAGIPVLGMPLGLALSLGVFPLSWILIVIFFWKAR